jgi:hypothetical protein
MAQGVWVWTPKPQKFSWWEASGASSVAQLLAAHPGCEALAFQGSLLPPGSPVPPEALSAPSSDAKHPRAGDSFLVAVLFARCGDAAVAGDDASPWVPRGGRAHAVGGAKDLVKVGIPADEAIHSVATSDPSLSGSPFRHLPSAGVALLDKVRSSRGLPCD